ncbi:NAD(P)-binding domain-containing protein, partial [Acidimicrobiales bacterium]|nr:NAD(P)-binding domain-containing protein [Acidimicrobiales bacterium]
MTDTKPLVVWTTCHPWIQEVVAEVQPDEFDVEFLDLNDADAVAATLPRVDALICLSLTTEQCRMLDRCKLVMHNGVGYDAIDIETLTEMGIPVAVTPVMTPEGVAEHALMLILALSKQLPAVQQSMKSGEWNMLGWREGSHNLSYKTLGIIGVGRIGKRIAHLAHAFGCRILYTDIVEAPAELVQAYGLERVERDVLIAQADIITLHVPLTDQTRSMFGAEEFASMKPGAIFINTSRGPTYDLEALVDSVESGHLFGAGVDVFDPEPPPGDHRVFSVMNIITTPHISSGTVERQYAINRAQFANA